MAHTPGRRLACDVGAVAAAHVVDRTSARDARICGSCAHLSALWCRRRSIRRTPCAAPRYPFLRAAAPAAMPSPLPRRQNDPWGQKCHQHLWPRRTRPVPQVGTTPASRSWFPVPPSIPKDPCSQRCSRELQPRGHPHPATAARRGRRVAARQKGPRNLPPHRPKAAHSQKCAHR
eukprot:scaffold222665_cov28-Tisochrysis_lutea.AAC.6